MPNEMREVTFGVSEERFPEGLHVCYLYSDDAEHARTLARFLIRGLQEGDKAICLVENKTPEEMLAELASHGLDMKWAEGRLTTATAGETYCPAPVFEPDSLLSSLRNFVQNARQEGYAGARITGDMSWIHRKGVSVAEVLEYEAKVLKYIDGIRCTALCEYDARKFDGATLLDVLSVHPAMIVNGQMVKNPYYQNPEDVLARYRERPTAKA